MKKIIYLSGFLLLLVSCRSIEKLVERGEYDEAIFLAANRLAGKKNKKTKHVKALERAFAKITENDMATIRSLDAEKYPYHWKDVLNVVNKIENRQNRIEAFLPLVSKDGYKARFNFVRTSEMKNKALDGAAAYHYGRALNWLTTADKNEDHLLARKAFYEFEKTLYFRKDYKDTRSRMFEAKEMGISHVLIDIYDKDLVSRELMWSRELLKDILNKLTQNEWQRFYINDDDAGFDYIAQIRINSAFVSPEREIINRHTDRKKIKDGWVYVKKKDGEIKTDSLGNKIKRDVYRNVVAQITEIFREKSSIIDAELIIHRTKDNSPVMREAFRSETNFEDIAVNFRGDRRAVCGEDIPRIKDFPLPFPTDMEILAGTTELLSQQLEGFILDLDI